MLALFHLPLISSYLCAVLARTSCSNGARHTSVVALKKHSSVEDYINSIIHEAEHVKQAMLSTYMIEDKGEPPAYTIGYLVMRMWRVFKQFLCI